MEQGLSNIIGCKALFSAYGFTQNGDPIIVGINFLDNRFADRNQNFQLSLYYKLGQHSLNTKFYLDLMLKLFVKI